MAYPEGWPPRPASGARSIRFFVEGTATADFADSAYLFADDPGANTFLPTPYVAPGGEGTLAEVGTNLVGGSPMGGGRDVHDASGGVAVPHPMIWSHGIAIFNDGGADLEYTFDGTNVAGKVLVTDDPHWYYTRYEAGIAIRGAGAKFRVIAW